MEPRVVLIFLLFVYDVHGQSQGPVLVVEPPPRLVFSSTTGGRADCAALGNPPPVISWLMHDDAPVTTVPGLRLVVENGSLIFPPFPGPDFRQEVHSAIYRCRAANIAGAVVSRDMRISAVISDNYEPRVLGARGSIGSPAVLTCDTREHITVTSWFKDDAIIVPTPPDAGSRLLSTSKGELVIRYLIQDDSNTGYSCLTINGLTGERKKSQPTAIVVNDAPSGMAPRLLTQTSEIVQENGRDVHLLCSALGQPTPTYSWFREINGQLFPVISSPRVVVSQDVLFLRRAEVTESGSWICMARNQFGEQRSHTTLVITSPLAAHIHPQLLVANTGSMAVLNCSTTGNPPGRVRWLHDGTEVARGSHVRISSSGNQHSLIIPRVSRTDKGMYQCIVSGSIGSAQATAELKLGDMAPELQYTFIEQALRGGPPISLRCSAAGAPPPRFQWLLDGQPLLEIASSHRYDVGQYVSKNGDIVGHLNISSVRTEDGGLYTCIATNSLGEASHTARLNIYGPPSIRALGPIKVVAGSNTTVHCPYAGYPVNSVHWMRRGQDITNTLRVASSNTGALSIQKVDPATDAGSYTCVVTAPTGDTVKRDLQVVVKNPPKLVPFSFPPDLEERSSAQVLCGMTSGDRPVYFSWLKDGQPIPTSLSIQEKSLDEFSFLIFNDVSSKHSGDYTCVASNSAAKVNYTAQLLVKVSPQWIHEPNDISTLLGTPISIHCSARGFPEPKITWLRSQTTTPPDFRPLVEFDNRQMIMSNGSLVIPAASTYNEGQYLCKAENGIGTGLSKMIHVTVNEPAHFEVSSKNISARRNNPVTLVCEVFGDNPIQVQWTHNMKRIDLNSYRVSISEVRTEGGLRSQLSINRAERRDSGTYRCQAENPYGRSEHLINLAVQEQPDPPQSLQMIEVGSRTVRLSWIRGFDGNAPLLGYLVQYQLLGSLNKDDWLAAKVFNVSMDSVKTSHNSEDIARHGGDVGLSDATICDTLVTGLHPATAYTVRLASYNNIESSPYSEPVVVKTQEEAPTEPPLNVQVQVGGQGELYVSWKAPSHDSWNGELLGYLVTWTEMNPNGPFPTFNTNTSKSLTVNGWTNSNTMLTGLKKFTRYGVSVRAFNGVAAGPPSSPITATTQEGVPDFAPTNIICSALSSQSLKISWEPLPVTTHNGVLQGYKVIYRPVDGFNSMVRASAEIKRTTSAETYLHGLRRFTNYSIQVLAYTAAGDGKRSQPIHCITDEDLPGPPSTIKALAATIDSILVSWLPPLLKNGKITHYTVYSREAGRVGKHSTMTILADGTGSTGGSGSILGEGGCLAAEIKGLGENKLYEFWVSAATGSGEGEPTAIVAQGTNSRAPARIASFSQSLQLPLHSTILLSCLTVGNPTPRTRWLHRGRPVTHSPHYQVSQQGHLDIHSMDPSLSGNYTCSAKNLFGEDTITYGITTLLPPAAPQLRVQHVGTNSFHIQWPTVQDGGSLIYGYMLSYARDGEDWQSIPISSEVQSYTLDSLSCGSPYIVYMEAINSIGRGSPSDRLKVNTKGGVSKVPNEKDLINTNSSCMNINLLTWDNGGCPITEFLIEYRPLTESTWASLRTVLKTDGLVIENLRPGTWYYLRITAINDAGSTTGKFYFSTLNTDGSRIAPPAVFPPHWDADNPQMDVFGNFSVVLAGLATFALISLGILIFLILKNKEGRMVNCFSKGYSRGDISEDEKSIENQDNRRNCQQVYTSSPTKHSSQKSDSQSEMYEISPYATFSMGNGPTGGNVGSNGRSVTASTLDYTVQFRTFGRSEGEALGPAPARPNLLGHDRKTSKHRSFSSSDEYTLSKAMTLAAGGSSSRSRATRHGVNHAPADSESDSSGSPCTECNSNQTYRLPVNSHSHKDMFRPVADSSAESQSEMSPGGGITGGSSHRTPRRTAAYVTGGRSQYRQEQERREFTIHV